MKKKCKQDVANESHGHYLFARIPFSENLLKGGDPLKGLPPLYLNA